MVKNRNSSYKGKNANEGRAGDGVFYDAASGSWGFRVKREGKDVRRKGFKTKTEAKQARALFVVDLENKAPAGDVVKTITLGEVFTHYITEGANGKRDATKTRQRSLWKNHVELLFGNRDIETITAGELSRFLTTLYTKGSEANGRDTGYSYAYVEGFTKFFFMLWTYARREHFVSKEMYEELWMDDGTRVKMPKRQDGDDEEDEPCTYTNEEIERMRLRLKEHDSDCLLSFELGYYLGLRISETYGLMFDDFDFDKSTVSIQRQLLKMSDHQWSLVPVKTTTAKRTIYVPSPLLELVKQEKEKQEQNKAKYGSGWKGTETVRVRMREGQDDALTAGNFINRSKYGALLTSDSMKSWGKNFKNELGIHFKYHYLRHTHASLCAAYNMPIRELLKRMGHKKIWLC